MKDKLTKFLTVGALAVGFTLGAASYDGGIVDVSGRLNVRSAARIDASVKAKLWDGQVITVYHKEGDWWYVEYSPSNFGYVHSDYITELNLKKATVITKSSSLNVRAEASANSKIIGSLKKGDEVLILGEYGTFYKILYSGNLVGYASSAYLQVSNLKGITLSLPSYKQYDKAYSSLKLPGSGESVYTHGCAVTSLAMTESYRTGKKITPKTVIETEKFTDSGAIYWPRQYTRGEDTLEYIYSQLHFGKPVIIHAKKLNGTSHFAVVYGFSGTSLENGNFKILDPGSSSRKSLADLYKEYPTLVKTVSY